jgi:hypothetical protein
VGERDWELEVALVPVHSGVAGDAEALQLVVFPDDQEMVEAPPEVMEVGFMERDRVGAGDAEPYSSAPMS